MIVPMAKVSLVVLERHRADSLKELRRLGVMHVAVGAAVGTGDAQVEALREQRAVVTRALQLLEAEAAAGAGPSAPAADGDPLDLARAMVAAFDREQAADQERVRLQRLATALEPWGEFDPADLTWLADQGVLIHLLQMTPAEAAGLPADLVRVPLGGDKEQVRLAVVTRAGGQVPALPGTPLPLPDAGLAALRAQMARLEAESARLRQERVALAGSAAALERRRAELDAAVEFQRVALSMGDEGPLVTLTGFVPRDEVARLQQASARGGWALLVDEPGAQDEVPTLVRNPAWVRTIQPVLDFLGTLPGYREYDISLWFLLFFSVFWGMIVADGGYGLIYLALGLWGRSRYPKAQELFRLIIVASVVTIVYGAITGTWFGARSLADWPPLRALTIDAIASYPLREANPSANVMAICFLIGAVHITIAHVVNFVRKLPSLGAFQEPGWLAVLWGMYFAIQILVLKRAGETPLAGWFPLSAVTYAQAGMGLVGFGLVLIILFGEQKGKVGEGVLMGLAWLPLKLLNSVSAFADTVSYVRLFAVGLAGVKVAAAVNDMAAGVGHGFPAIIGVLLITILGHGLNLMMGALALVVHGVRLNVLEFSNHLGLEWKGTAYSPFREDEAPPGAIRTGRAT